MPIKLATVRGFQQHLSPFFRMPSEILLFNTMTRSIEPLRPLDGQTVKFYVCGPTIYNFGHIGNFRTYVAVDLLRRSLKLLGYGVQEVMQFTDVDDKTIRGSRSANLPLQQFTERFRQAFLEDSSALNLDKIEHQPNATDHIPAMVRLIQDLIGKGFAYPTDDGSVYFRIQSFPRYGCLCHLDMAGLQHGHRIAVDEYEKEGVGDFVLWKTWVPEDGDVAWQSPWGKGRPGWHIECSALAHEFLGEEIDLHAGGVDLRFPHHENELAQSEASTGKTFSRHWFHVDHLLVENQKMAKAANNFFTLRDVLEKGYSGRELRYLLISSAHYRRNLNFSWKGMDDARAALNRLDEWRKRLQDFVQNGVSQAVSDSTDAADSADASVGTGAELVAAFQEAIQNDLNISDGLGSIFQEVRAVHRALNSGTLTKEVASGYLEAWKTIDQVLGLGEANETIPETVLALVEARREARTKKDFKASDELRKQVAALGWQIKDGPKGAQELIKG